jgi:CheY-like chemotaxis protein
MQPRKVLILDDNILHVMRAARSLEACGYTVVRMSSPNGALAKVEFERPEVLLLELKMSRLHVDDLLAKLRQNPEMEDLIIVLFSDLEADVLQQYCIDNDIHGYYCKSMDIDAVGDFLDNFYEEE